MTDNQTNELRKLLTERGIEWTKPKSATEFIQTTFLHNGWGIEVLERYIGLCVTATNVFDTPEQAIAATLGSERERKLELLVKHLWYLVNHGSGYGYAAALEVIEELGIEVDE